MTASAETPTTPQIPISAATLKFLPSPAPSPAIGEQLTLSLNIADGENVAAYQATVQFDGTALRYVSSAIGDYLPAGAFPLPAEASGNTVTLAAVSLTGESAGDGTLSTITFEVIAVKESTLTLSGVLLSDSAETASRPQVEAGLIVEPPQLKEDVNGDGVVNILDLVRVASSFGGIGRKRRGCERGWSCEHPGFGVGGGGVWERGGCALHRSTSNNDADGYRRGTVVGSSRGIRTRGYNSSKGRSFLGATSRSADAERDGAITKLSEPVQPGDVDPVWVGKRHACANLYLRHQR